MIEKMIKALEEKNPEALAECFSENCSFADYCPALDGAPCSHIYGKPAVEMYFKLKFLSDELEIKEPIIEDEKHATFFETCGGPYIYAGLDITELDEAGLIKKAVVRPA